MTVPPAELLPSPSSRGDAAPRPERMNIAERLTMLAVVRPAQAAVIVPHCSGPRARVTFAELDRLSNRYANSLADAGIERGMRALLMVRPGIDFFALTFAMFKLGALPVMVDPGMGLDRMLECIRQVDPRGFVGIPLAHAMRVLRPGSFRSIKHVVTVGRRWFWGGHSLRKLASRSSESFPMAETRSDEPAAILFTSGSTGPAKGVVYEHGMFDAQVRLIQTQYSFQPGETDVPTFPLFALFSVAMGMTAVIPDMDASRPGQADPAKIVEAIQRHQATSSFGSPALWRNVASYCVERGIQLPTLRRILIAGASVPRRVIEQLHCVISPDADVFTPYGATEALPVASLAGREHQLRIANYELPRGEPQSTIDSGAPESALCSDNRQSTMGEPQDRSPWRAQPWRGTCVGFPFDEIDVTIIRITDEPIHEWDDDLLVKDGEVGELVVTGPVVTKEYFGLPWANALSKIREGDTLWHRMGDLGYRDDDGRIWFCGRKSQRVETSDGPLFTECIEPVFNDHPEVARSALVGIGPRGSQRPVIIVEPQDRRLPEDSRAEKLGGELLQYAREKAPAVQAASAAPLVNNRPSTIAIQQSALDHQVPWFWRANPAVVFHKSLPVDVRHNAKINREALAAWAAQKLR